MLLFCFQISTLQNQIHSQESDLQYQEEELSRVKADLGRLQQEENQLEQSLAAGKIQLETIIKSLKATQDEINQVGSQVCPSLALILSFSDQTNEKQLPDSRKLNCF